MVADAQGDEVPIQRVADAVAARFVPTVIAIAVLAFVAWDMARRGSRNGVDRDDRRAGNRVSVRDGTRLRRLR